MEKLALTVPVTNAWPDGGVETIKRIKTCNKSSMKNYFLNALLMISIVGRACNSTAANTLIAQACVEFQDKKPSKKLSSFQSVIKSKSMDT